MLDRVGARLAARERDGGDLVELRAVLLQPAAEHPAHLRQDLRVGGEAHAQRRLHGHDAQGHDGDVVIAAAGRHELLGDPLAELLGGGRHGGHRPQALETDRERLAAALDQAVGVEQDRVAGASLSSASWKAENGRLPSGGAGVASIREASRPDRTRTGGG